MQGEKKEKVKKEKKEQIVEIQGQGLVFAVSKDKPFIPDNKHDDQRGREKKENEL
jgi:hypothetical protein